MGEMKKIIGYVRVSTTKQRDEGVSLDAQKRKLLLYAEMYELDLVGIEVDVASGKSMKGRPALQRCLDALANGDVDGMLIVKLDRLTRRVRDVCLLVEEYFQTKRLISVGDQIDTQTPNGVLMLNLLTTLAQWEREQLSVRTTEALGYLKSTGVKLGQLPYGCMYGDADENGRLTILESPEEVVVIKYMVDMREQGFSYRKIADVLTLGGHPTKRNGSWQACTVREIINRLTVV